ncbi:MAG: leucine-rich repeat protein [Bacteroidales bacterium]|nr:leucine-rich repeat protein [Bacteroidales bacterium]
MRYLRIIILLLLVASCQQVNLTDSHLQDERYELRIQGVKDKEYKTRVNDSGFTTGDRMGVYVIDYDENTQPGTLGGSKHRATNMIYTYDAEEEIWSNQAVLYWKDATTPIDVYGYSPAVDYIADPTKYRFEVDYRQDVMQSDGSMSAYEASDFIWAKAEKVSPTEETIVLNYSHRMACVKVVLVKGEGFEDSEWGGFQKSVQVDNVVRSAIIDLSNGIPVPEGSVDKSVLMLPQSSDEYRAIVVPQTVAAGNTLLSLTIDGITYTHSLNSDMKYESGKLYNFEIQVNRRESGAFECKLSCNGIVDWTNEEGNNFTSNTFITVNVTQAGTLSEIIGESYAGIENLKLTGNLNADDFAYIRSTLNSLVRINLEDVKLSQIESCWYWDCDNKKEVQGFLDDYLPNYALENMKSLRQIILPQGLKHIGNDALKELKLTSPLIIPEGVTHIHHTAFYKCDADVVMPHTLEYIGNHAFPGYEEEKPVMELVMTDKLRYIGEGAFRGNRGMTGTFYLSPNLEYIGESAFLGSGTGLSGDIVIPSGITEISKTAFAEMGFANGTDLVLHDGLRKIGMAAFRNTKIRNFPDWPQSLVIIESQAFSNSGLKIQNFVFPSQIKSIGAGAFNRNALRGVLEIPNTLSILGAGNSYGVFSDTEIESVITGDNLLHIGHQSFRNCTTLTKVQLGRNVDYIGKQAFNSCRALGTLVCLATEPPMADDEAFNGIPFDKCILQVPEKSVDKYRNADEWKQFKNITAYKELAFNIPEIVTLDKGGVRSGIIRAEGPWTVTAPDWVTVVPSSGQGKAEVTVTVHPQNVGSSTREGEIEFLLTGKDYTTSTIVRQVGASVGEDQTVTLYQAEASGYKAVPLFIVGDGYDADDIANGTYLSDMKEQMDYFFSIEPMKSYKEYFTVSTAYAVSPESGVSGLTRFDSEYYGDLHGDNNKVLEYAKQFGIGIDGNEENATIIVLMNTDVTANSTTLYDSGLAISWMGKSKDVYPYDQKGCVLHEAVGKAFGKLGPETISHLTFIEACGCPGCNMASEYDRAKSNGWWANVSRTNKLKSLPWYHLFAEEKYASIVDVYEGACNHSRGAYRSESQSVMGNAYVPYFNTISRETLVRRIMKCAGKEFIFADFVEKDIIELPE